MYRLGSSWQRWLITTVVVTLSACATFPGGDTPVSMSRSAVPVTIGVDGALPGGDARGAPMLASRVGIGSGDAPWRYDARYAIEPGELFTAEKLAAGAPPPQRLGGQRIGQELSMRLPEIGGAPLKLLASSDTREYWTTAGDRIDQHRQQARIGWSRPMAYLELQWVGGDGAIDSRHALGCGLRGTMEMPLSDSAAPVRQSLRISGRECRVRSGDARFDALAADAWGLGLAWTGATHETELLLAMIDPVWATVVDRQDIDPSYELGVSHRRDHGEWSVRTQVAMRYTTAWDLAAPIADTGAYPGYSAGFLTASASLTRHLPAMSVSANWAHSADPLWFMPEVGQRKHRFDMRMDLSPLMAALVSDAEPQVSMHWNWSQARSRTDAVTGDMSVRLNMAVVF